MITKLSISLPQSLETFARSQVRNGGYGSISEYFRELIRIDQRLTEMRRVRKDMPRESALQRELDRVRHGR